MFECLAVFKIERTRAKSSKSIFQVSDRTLPASVNTIFISMAKVGNNCEFRELFHKKMKKKARLFRIVSQVPRERWKMGKDKIVLPLIYLIMLMRKL